MDRKDELLNICKDMNADIQKILLPMIDDIIFLEITLHNLRKLPFIRVSTKNNKVQEITPASKQYKELLQQYNNCLKIFFSVMGKSDGGDGDSPLRSGMKALYEKYK